MVKAVPLPMGGALQVFMTAQQPSLVFTPPGDLHAAATQGRQVGGPQQQNAVAPELQSRLGLAPPGPNAMGLIPSLSSVRGPETNDYALAGDGCNAAAQNGQTDSCRMRSI
jgi:hypothetical protein